MDRRGSGQHIKRAQGPVQGLLAGRVRVAFSCSCGKGLGCSCTGWTSSRVSGNPLQRESRLALFLTTHHQGCPLQPSVRSGNAARATPSKPRPVALAPRGIEPSSHQHRFLPTSVPPGDLPLQILIQLTLLSLSDLRR